MDADEFKRRFGREPRNDDLDRVNCTKAGQSGHFLCGLCPEHRKPLFMCGCMDVNMWLLDYERRRRCN